MRGGEAGTCALMDPTCMCTTTRQRSVESVSQPVRVQETRGGGQALAASFEVVFIAVRILVLIMVAWSSLLTAAADVRATMPRRAARVTRAGVVFILWKEGVEGSGSIIVRLHVYSANFVAV